MMLPFLNCFLLYILWTNGQLLNKYWVRFEENALPRLPSFMVKMLSCVLCTSFWMGVTQELIMGELTIFVFYNAVTTTILYKLLK
jgi:hypothetical protein